MCCIYFYLNAWVCVYIFFFSFMPPLLLPASYVCVCMCVRVRVRVHCRMLNIILLLSSWSETTNEVHTFEWVSYVVLCSILHWSTHNKACICMFICVYVPPAVALFKYNNAFVYLFVRIFSPLLRQQYVFVGPCVCAWHLSPPRRPFTWRCCYAGEPSSH